MDKIRNENIRGTAQVEGFGDKLKEDEMVWTFAEEE